MTSPRLAFAALVLSATPAAAETASVKSTVNLRASAGTGSEIIAKIPGGSLVEAANCSEWCEVSWKGRKGFVVAASIDRTGTARVKPAQRDLFATDVSKSDVPMSLGGYIAPERYYGPYFWTYGPPSSPFKGTSGIGFRGRW